MLTPVPGLTHLKVLLPDAPVPHLPSPVPPVEDAGRRRAGALVRLALETAFGMRPLPRSRDSPFATPARLHITARHRSGPRGPVRVDTLHVRDGDGIGGEDAHEVFGTAVANGKAHAFTARVEGRRLVSFRVL